MDYNHDRRYLVYSGNDSRIGMPALAALFELADFTTGNGSGETVSLKHAQRAAAWCDYLESRVVFDDVAVIH